MSLEKEFVVFQSGARPRTALSMGQECGVARELPRREARLIQTGRRPSGRQGADITQRSSVPPWTLARPRVGRAARGPGPQTRQVLDGQRVVPVPKLGRCWPELAGRVEPPGPGRGPLFGPLRVSGPHRASARGHVVGSPQCRWLCVASLSSCVTRSRVITLREVRHPNMCVVFL